jgi:hypothetical protein
MNLVNLVFWLLLRWDDMNLVLWLLLRWDGMNLVFCCAWDKMRMEKIKEKIVTEFLLFSLFRERFSQVHYFWKDFENGTRARHHGLWRRGITSWRHGLDIEVDDVITSVTSQFLHLPSHRHIARRRGGKCKFCVLSLLFWCVWNLTSIFVPSNYNDKYYCFIISTLAVIIINTITL